MVSGGRLLAREAVAEGIRAGCVVDVAGERSEAGAVRHRLEVHRHRQARAAVVPVLQHRDAAAAGRLPRDLHAVLDRFRARVHEDRLLRERPGGALGDELRDAHVGLVRRDGEERVEEVPELLARGGDDGVVRVTDRRDPDAGAEVDEAVAVDVLDDRAVGPLDVDGEAAAHTDGDGLQPTLVEHEGLRSRHLRHDPPPGEGVVGHGLGQHGCHTHSLRTWARGVPSSAGWPRMLRCIFRVGSCPPSSP